MTDDAITLHHGSHKTFEDGHCLMEVVAHLDGAPHSDHPECACPVHAYFGRGLNDRIATDEERTRLLLPAATLLVGSRLTPDDELVRGFLYADLAVRRWAPIALGASGLREQAEELQKLPKIADRDTAKIAWDVARAAAHQMPSIAYRNIATAYAATAISGAAATAYAATGTGTDAATAATIAATIAATAITTDAAVNDAAACFIAMLKGEDPWKTVSLPEGIGQQH